MFQLDERLQQDTLFVGRFSLCALLMSKDANYPWFILVPQRQGVTELYHLRPSDLSQLTEESRMLSIALMDIFGGVKLNVAALGNLVPQLHIHHIVRYENDLAWPNPVWGATEAATFSPEEQKSRLLKVQKMLSKSFTAVATLN